MRGVDRGRCLGGRPVRIRESNDVANAAQEAWHHAADADGARADRAARRPCPPTEAPDAQAPDDTTDLDGKIVIDIGDGDPIVIDLGDLGSLRRRQDLAISASSSSASVICRSTSISMVGRALDVFGSSATQITVTGPNGLTVLDFGEGDGSVTITKKDGELTISSEGDVQENDLTAPDVSGTCCRRCPTSTRSTSAWRTPPADR